MLSETRLQKPICPSIEVVGSVNASPSHMGSICMKEALEVVLTVITKLFSSLQFGVVADSEKTNRVVDAVITSPALKRGPPPLVAEK